MIGLHKVLYHICNSFHKLLHGILALCYKGKGIFPISGKFRGLHHIRKHRNQFHSVLCRDHLLFLTFHETILDQLLNDVRSGGRCAESFTLHIISHIFTSGSLHCRQKGIFRKMLRRCGVMLADFRLYPVKGLPLGKLWQLLILLLFLFRGLKRTLKSILKIFPSVF